MKTANAADLAYDRAGVNRRRQLFRLDEAQRVLADYCLFHLLFAAALGQAGPLKRERAERMDGLPDWIAETIRPARAARDAADPNRVMEQPQDVMELGRSGLRKRQQFIRMCAEAGVRLVTGTDFTGLGEDLPGRGVQQELGYLVACGLTPLAALRASTITAAAALGKEREMGAIERGKLADILVLDKDPLAEVRNIAAIRAVVHGGRATTPAELLAAPPPEPETPYAR